MRPQGTVEWAREGVRAAPGPRWASGGRRGGRRAKVGGWGRAWGAQAACGGQACWGQALLGRGDVGVGGRGPACWGQALLAGWCFCVGVGGAAGEKRSSTAVSVQQRFALQPPPPTPANTCCMLGRSVVHPRCVVPGTRLATHAGARRHAHTHACRRTPFPLRFHSRAFSRSW